MILFKNINILLLDLIDYEIIVTLNLFLNLKKMLIFGFMLIFFINFSSYLSAIIIIPFQTYNPLLIKNEKFFELIKGASDKEIIETITRNLVYTELIIGMEKKQKIITFIEMGNNELYFIDLNHHTGLPPLREIKNSNFSYNNNYLLNNIFKLNFYNSSLSDTYQYVRSCPEYLDDYYYDRDVFAKEKIYVKQKNKTTYKEKYEPIIFFADFKEYESWDHRPGVIGFELGDSEFIQRLKQLKIIKNYDWNIKYTNFSEEKGEIIIGDLPHIYDKKNYDEDNLRVANITSGNHHQWSLVFDHIFIESNNSKIKYNYKRKNDIGTFYIEEFFILGTYDYFSLIEKIFFSKYIKENICQKQTHKKLGQDNEYYHFMCYLNDNKKLKEFLNNFPSLTFYQGEMDFNFTLDSNDLFTIFPDNNRVLFNVESYNDSNSWVLGKPFFKKYQLNFNHEENIIGYYTNSNTNKYNKKSNVNIYFIIFFIFIFAFLLFFKLVFCKYNRKLRANELEDNYNYISNSDKDNEKELN